VPKLQAARATGSSVPEPWIVTKEGQLSSDPKDFDDGGAILPMGGLSSGHKGYALSFMVMLFGATLGNLGSDDVPEAQYRKDGSSIIVIDLGGMAAIGDVGAQVEEVVRDIKETPPMEGFSEVLYPGELEARSRRKRLVNGVPIAQDARWDHVVRLVDEYGLREQLKDHLGV
jgi:LDH2 family malate/lactate/ureidoglycolate dehydrogenase